MGKLPGIEGCLETYLDAWYVFEDDEFSVEYLRFRLIQSGVDQDRIPGESALNRRLYRLAAYGLVAWYGEGDYKVRLDPDEDSDEWKRSIGQRVEMVHEKVQERQDEHELTMSTNTDNNSPEIIQHQGEKYVSAFVGKDSDVEGQAAYYLNVLDRDEGHAGVVLRSYPRWVDAVEKLADSICDDSSMANTVCPYRFEQDHSDLMKNDGEMEFRIYARENKFLN